MEPRKEAQDLLVHYVEQAGVRFGPDTELELRNLVDYIIQAAVDEVFKTRAMRQLLESHV